MWVTMTAKNVSVMSVCQWLRPLLMRDRLGDYEPIYGHGSLEGGSECGSGEVRGVSDCRFKKACPCQFL